MTRRCTVTGKTVMSGHNVSHANNKSKRRFLPNLQRKRVLSDILDQAIPLRLSTNALGSIEFHGGLDAFVLRAKKANLTPELLRIRQLIESKQAATAASA